MIALLPNNLLPDNLLRGNALPALAAAILWGGGDFSGGMGVKSAGGGVRAALRVVLLSHAASFVTLLALACLRGEPAPHGALLAWGIAAGVAGGLSLTAFYTALSRGAMGASAAVSGLLAAAIPAALTMWREGSPGARALLGFAVAGLAIWLIAAGSSVRTAMGADGHTARGTAALAMLAGVGFGIYFIALKNAGPAGLIWPMASARMGSLSVCSLTLLGLQLGSGGGDARPRITLGGRAVGWALSTALLDTSGNLCFVTATRAGRLDVAAVLASLYPATTILLAAFALGERPTRRQALGMATAVVAVVLIAM
jgi:drug/metabolite transporter (DMT)-like permease